MIRKYYIDIEQKFQKRVIVIFGMEHEIPFAVNFGLLKLAGVSEFIPKDAIFPGSSARTHYEFIDSKKMLQAEELLSASKFEFGGW